MCTGWSYGERNFFSWWLFKSKICLQDYFPPSLFPHNKGRTKINSVVLMPEDRCACLFTLSWFVTSKPVIHGQFFTSFHTRVLKSAVPPCSECLKPECLFLRKSVSEDTPDYDFFWNLCCVLDLIASQVRFSCELNQFSSVQCLAAGRWALQSLLHGVCCMVALPGCKWCSVHSQTLQKCHTLQIAQPDVALNSSDLALYHHRAFFKWFGLGLFFFCLVFNLTTEKTEC